MVRKTCWWDVSPEHAYKHPNWLISKGPYCGYHRRSRCSRKPSEGPYFPYCPSGWSAKTMRGSLFPLFPLFWWSMSWQDEKTWRTKIGEIGTLSWFWHFTQGKRWEGPYFPLPLRVKCQNHERVPISPIAPKGEVPKPWEGPYFPYFGGPCLDKMKRHGPPK